MLGMIERVRQLGGTLTIKNAQPGVAVRVAVPEEEQSATEEPAYADPAD
jgi:glucose-6-phosphate-specific signal transduction histidine kinase